MNLEQVEELAKLAAQAEVGRLAPVRRFVAEASEEQARAAEQPKEAPRKAEGKIPVAPVAVVSSLGVGAGRAPASTPAPAPLPEAARAPMMAAQAPMMKMPAPPAPRVQQAAPPAAPERLSPLPAPPETPSVSFVPMAELPAWGMSTATAVTPVGPVLPFRPAPRPASQPAAPAQPAPAPPAPAQPAPAPPSTRGDSMPSLGQYASLCAELALFPAAAEAIFRRYGLESLERRAAVDAAWKERLRRDPAEYQAWQDLYQRWHAHLSAGGAPPG